MPLIFYESKHSKPWIVWYSNSGTVEVVLGTASHLINIPFHAVFHQGGTFVAYALVETVVRW